MKNLKNTFAAAALMAVMLLGTTFANAGIIILNRDGSAAEPCTVKTESNQKKDEAERGGIIILNIVGIIILNFSSSTDSDSCEAEQADKGGIIILN